MSTQTSDGPLERDSSVRRGNDGNHREQNLEEGGSGMLVLAGDDQLGAYEPVE